MTIQAIFLLQFFSSLLVMGLLAKWLLAPHLAKLALNEALFWLTLPHAFRYLGMVFLVPGVVDQPLPDSFAIPAAYGDLLAAVLALLALIALRNRLAGAIGAVWLFNIAGSPTERLALLQELKKLQSIHATLESDIHNLELDAARLQGEYDALDAEYKF